MLVLGIESSCDETAVGIVDDRRTILANVVASQIEAHRPFGGVVPEVAARAHLEKVDELVRAALDEAGVGMDAIDGFAATCGPGLIGGVMVGAVTGKALAAVMKKPFLAVNHIEAHALTARLTHDVAFPYLLLLMSGGHCQLVFARALGDYQKLGGTLDDAVGECFDKSAKLLGLGYPGGPMIERAAVDGDPTAFSFPRPLVGRPGCDFSFSGLKTAVRHRVEQLTNEGLFSSTCVPSLAASLQAAIADILDDRTTQAFRQLSSPPTALVVGGGVAANRALRARLEQVAARHAVPFLAPPPALCTDNGVMIAWAGLEYLRSGRMSPLDVRARPRWPLASSSSATV
jgi:N6-L-threonylcarbamoyladenine synthase